MPAAPAAATPPLDAFADPGELRALIAAARREDLGPAGRDLTSELTVAAGATGSASIRSRAVGRLAGAALLPMIAAAYDPALELDVKLDDGAALKPAAVVAHVRGPLRALLAMERVALNFLTHLCGIASLTARYVEAVRGTQAGIYDTRKTIPGLRRLAKYAVTCGGGHAHRVGLHDAVLVKDNHIAAVPLDRLTDFVADMVRRAAALQPPPAFVEVEVDTIEQLKRVLPAMAASPGSIVLLDNMKLDQLRTAVNVRNQAAPGVLLEASGGVGLDTVIGIARTGVDRIAVGALTHSAPALDLGLDVRTA